MKAYIIYKHVLSLDAKQYMIGGIETYLLTLAQVIKGMNITPIIVQCGNSNFDKECDNIRFIGFPTSSKKPHKELYNKIKGQIEADDIIIWGSDMDSIKVDHERTIAIQHGIDFDYFPVESPLRNNMLKFGLGHLVKFLQRRRALRTFNRAKYKVCVDYNFWNWYRTFALPSEESNIFVIPNFAKIVPLDIKKNEKVNVVFARRFVRRRGIEVFIDVVKKLAKNSNLTFTFAGSGPYQDQIEALSKEFNNVYITKYNPNDAITFHSQFDIAVVPTIGSEGTSLSLLEAMSASNAVICTAVGGMTNIILDGYNGFIVSPNSAQQIIEKIEMLSSDTELRTRISKTAHESVKYAFSYEMWKEKWEMVIRNIINL